jgi:hypothetical protein
MTIDISGYDRLPPRIGRRLLLKALGRALISAALLVWAYYLLPLDRHAATHTVILLIVSLTAFAIVLVFQIRAVINAPYPTLRAVETLFVVLPLLLLSFAAVYYALGRSNPASFTQHLTRTDAIYYTVTTFATVGYGDIAPVSETARVIATFQMLFNLIALGLGVRVLLGAVKIGQQRRS